MSVLGFTRETEFMNVCVCVCKEIYFMELADVVMEAEKTQDLYSVSWRFRRADDVVTFQMPIGLRLRKS